MNQPNRQGDCRPRGDETASVSTSLLQRVQTRDDAAWQRLLDLYVPLVYAWCRQAGLQSHDAVDVVQDVFQAVVRAVAGFRRQSPADTFRGWLRTITRNKVRDHFRQRGRQPVGVGGTDMQHQVLRLADGPCEEVDHEPEFVSLVHRALQCVRNEFEDRTWQAFWSMAVDQQPAAEVARQLRMTVGAVRQAKYKVLRRLRQEMGDAD